MKRRYLILGGSGFIGLHLARRVAEEMEGGDELILVDDFSRGASDRDWSEFLRANPTAKSVHADLTVPEAYAALHGAFTHVFLLAAMVGVRTAETVPERVLRTNTLIVLAALEWMRKSGSERLFYSSTSEVYAGGVTAGMVPVPTDESVPVVFQEFDNPRFSYAVSKFWGESAVRYWSSRFGLNAVIGRYHNVYGPRMGMDHVIPELTQRLLNGENPLRVRSTDQTRAFCFVDDAVRATLALIDTTDAMGKTVHIGNDREEVTIGELASAVMTALGILRRIESLAPPLGSVARRAPNIDRLRALTGYEPMVGLAAGVGRTVDWYKRQHEQRSTRPVAVEDARS